MRTGISARIALAAIAVAVVALAIVGVGVLLVGGQIFDKLMAAHGAPAAESHLMFDEAVTSVMLVAIVVAVIAAAGLAALLGTRIGAPLRDIGRAARSIAAGDFRARLPSSGTTEIVAVTDSFNQMAQALEEQERIRAEFIANAAHELRTPLTNLQGYLEALRDSVIPPDRQVFESLSEEVDRLVRLSHSLDELAQGDATPKRAPKDDLDLPASVRTAVELSRRSAQARAVELSADGPRILPVRADADGLAQILNNLLNNAVRYTPPSGQIRVTWEARPSEALVVVANTGDGIPASDLPHVFERFYRVEKSRDRERGGAGIGLAIVRQLVESLGGRVGAESADGLTRFWFTLPRAVG